jgi:hypothetical protein
MWLSDAGSRRTMLRFLTLPCLIVVELLVDHLIKPPAAMSPGMERLDLIAAIGLVAWLGGLLIVFVHEMSHAAVGTWLGLDLVRFTVGPLTIDFSDGRLRLRPNRFGSGIGGAVEFGVSSQPERNLRAQGWMIAAGPLSNILLGTLLVCVARADLLPSRVDTALLCIGVFSCVIGLRNLAPIRFGLFRSDGAKLQLLLRGGEPLRRAIEAQRIAGCIVAPTRPRHYPPATVGQAEAIVADWITAGRPLGRLDLAGVAAQLLFYHYADRGDLELTHRLLWVMTSGPRTRHQRHGGDCQVFDTLLAFHTALWTGDAATARVSLARVPRGGIIRGNSLWFGANAAIALAEGRREQALAAAARAQRCLKESGLRPGADQMEYEWLEHLIARAQPEPEPIGRPVAPQSS